MPQADDILHRPRINGGQHGVDFLCVILVHDHGDAQIRVFPANRADHFKAAQVRAHQEQAFAAGKQAAQRILAVHFKIKQYRSGG